jgi:hypothetical protein
MCRSCDSLFAVFSAELRRTSSILAIEQLFAGNTNFHVIRSFGDPLPLQSLHFPELAQGILGLSME